MSHTKDRGLVMLGSYKKRVTSRTVEPSMVIYK